jgi:HSP20 family protein
MTAQKSNQPSTPQRTSRGEQRSQQAGLVPRSGFPVLPSLFMSPFDLLNASPLSIFGSLLGRGEDVTPATWAPAIEVREQDGNLVVSAELPGLDEEDVRVEINNGTLVIQGERQQEREEEGGGIRRTEIRYGQFYRAIPLPDGIDPEQARAEFDNGVLRITIPLPQQSQQNVRQIEVKSAGSSQAPKTEKAA